ncbi:MAG: dTDP-glucose 4,6-dehydratase [Akkermansiaceae bacterium]|nr:dTDP-glucose 4,6-dehydratase [Akkermansiaceae bacterium]
MIARDATHLLVTGGAGFIGSALVRLLLAHPETTRVTVLDKFTYAGRRDHLPDDSRLSLIPGDIANRELVEQILAGGEITGVLNLAAESHVDRSIDRPADFVASNITGASTLLEACRTALIPLLQCSTDEVYGSIEAPGLFTEDSPIRPSSPYSASKAAADLLCLAAHHTYGQDLVITRGSNNYGPRQHPEKFIPRMVACALAGEPLPVYGSGLQVRDWIHVDDHAAGILAAYLNGHSGRVYNLGANCERTNLEMVREILAHLELPAAQVAHVNDRPGHDLRYAVDATRARAELSWEPRRDFATAFPETLRQLAAEHEKGAS